MSGTGLPYSGLQSAACEDDPGELARARKVILGRRRRPRCRVSPICEEPDAEAGLSVNNAVYTGSSITMARLPQVRSSTGRSAEKREGKTLFTGDTQAWKTDL
jgi:hypothetical protein